jgi:hypothetical protein
VVDLREVSSFSLSVKPNANHKHLVFVWDRDALRVLSDALEKQFPARDIAAEDVQLENELWL